MPDRLLPGPEEYGQMALGFLAIAVIVGLGALLLARFRGAMDKDGKDKAMSLTKFREMHSRGELSDEEYRTIKAKLAGEIRQRLKDSEEPG